MSNDIPERREFWVAVMREGKKAYYNHCTFSEDEEESREEAEWHAKNGAGKIIRIAHVRLEEVSDA